MSNDLSLSEDPLPMTRELFVSMTGDEDAASSVESPHPGYWSYWSYLPGYPEWREEDPEHPTAIGYLRIADLLIYALLARDLCAIDVCGTAFRYLRDQQLRLFDRVPTETELKALQACRRAWCLRAERLRAERLRAERGARP